MVDQPFVPHVVFGLDPMFVSTAILLATYAAIENDLVALNAQRDSIAGKMIAMLNAAAFDGKAINERQARRLIQQGENLLGQGNDQQGD